MASKVSREILTVPQAKAMADAWARSMHLGEQDVRPIHGQTTAEEAKALIEEGVPVAPLLVPVTPPKARN